MTLPASFTAGSTIFDTVTHNSHQFAVARGKKIEGATPDDLKFIYKIKMNGDKPYFISAANKSDKRWELPDLGLNNANATASAGDAAAIASPTQQQQQQTPPAQPPQAPAAAAPMSRTEAIERVRAMYMCYNRAKIADVDTVIASYDGRWEQLMAKLVDRYGSEPPPEQRAQLIAQFQQQQQQQASSPNLAAADSIVVPPSNNAANLAPADSIVVPQQPQSFTSASINVPPASPDRSGSMSPAAGAASPTAWTGSWRDRVYAIYRKYAPGQIKHVEKQLKTYEGHEQQLVDALVSKFGPEPPQPAKGTMVVNGPGPASPDSTAASPMMQQHDQQQQAANLAPADSIVVPPASTQDEDDVQRQLAMQQQQQQQQEQQQNAMSPQQQQHYSPSMANTGTLTDVAALPVPRAPLVTLNMPPPPTTPSPVFQTEQLLQAPASIRQEMLMAFLKDRDDRLREALDRNERYAQVISQLQDGHDSLQHEIESTRRSAASEQETLKSQLRETQRQMEVTRQKWSEDKDRFAANTEVAKLQAQRDIHSQLIALEETKIQYGKELSDLKSKLSVSSHASKAVREEATALLSVLARKEEQMRAQQEELNRLQQKLQGPAKVAASVQTQESLSDIIRSVAKHIGNQQSSQQRSASSEQESFREMSAQLAATTSAAAAGKPGQQLPLAQPNTCKRCSRGSAVLHCPACRLQLCVHCDDVVHASNKRFQVHRRVVIAITPESVARATGRSTSASTTHSSPGRYRSISESHHQDATAGLLPRDIDEQLASGMDADVFDRVIAQFDTAFAERRSQRTDEVDRLRAHVKELEESIAHNRSTSPNSRAAAAAARSLANGAAASSAGTPGASPIPHHGGDDTVAQVRMQIETEQRRNGELAQRIQELESLLLASPDHREFESPNAADVDDKKALEIQVQALNRDLDAARKEVKDKRKEITELRSLLAAHMSTPFGVIRSPAGAGKTPPALKSVHN